MFLVNLGLGQFLAIFGAISAISVVLYLLDRSRRRVVVLHAEVLGRRRAAYRRGAPQTHLAADFAASAIDQHAASFAGHRAVAHRVAHQSIAAARADPGNIGLDECALQRPPDAHGYGPRPRPRLCESASVERSGDAGPCRFSRHARHRVRIQSCQGSGGDHGLRAWLHVAQYQSGVEICPPAAGQYRAARRSGLCRKRARLRSRRGRVERHLEPARPHGCGPR